MISFRAGLRYFIYSTEHVPVRRSGFYLEEGTLYFKRWLFLKYFI